MFDLVEHLPIKDPQATTLQLHHEVQSKLTARATKLGYEVAGPARFRVIELPASMYVECRLSVVPLVKRRTK